MVTEQQPELKKRLGLFNDGMLGSASDLGTYTNREEELQFQNRQMQYLPNGGEVIYNPHYNSIEIAVRSLKAMHISYLNADYDSKVYNFWKHSTYNNQNGYDYIISHLGYRYVITDCRVSKPFLTNKIQIQCTIENNGFGNALQPLLFCISLQNNDSTITYQSECSVLCDTKKTISVTIPINELNDHEYQVYAYINDTIHYIDNDTQQKVLLGTLYIHY